MRFWMREWLQMMLQWVLKHLCQHFCEWVRNVNSVAKVKKGHSDAFEIIFRMLFQRGKIGAKTANQASELQQELLYIPGSSIRDLWNTTNFFGPLTIPHLKGNFTTWKGSRAALCRLSGLNPYHLIFATSDLWRQGEAPTSWMFDHLRMEY